MSDLKLGQLIEGEAFRDAIHVAVAPVVAADILNPGQHVAFIDGDTERVGSVVGSRKAIGIVDPFLNTLVPRGRRFWLYLFPNTVTGMRHEWQHPAFPTTAKEDSKQSKAEQWLRAFAVIHEADYAEMINAAMNGTGCCFGTTSGPEETRGWEFWNYMEELTGREFSEDHRRDVPFRCAC